MEETSTPVEQAVEDVRRSHSDTLETIELLRASRQQIEDQSALLESPKAILEYIDFFVDLLTRAAIDLERIAAELPGGPSRAHLDALRQMASNG